MTSLRDITDRQNRLIAESRATLDEMQLRGTSAGRRAELDRRFDDIMAEFDRLDLQINDNARAELRTGTRTASSYRSAFHNMLCAGGVIADLSPDDQAALRNGQRKFEKRVQVSTQGTSTTSGGYTVPTEMADFMVRSMKMWGPMYDEDICTVISTSTGATIKIPTVNDTSKSAGQHSEGSALTDDNSEDATFGQKSLEAYGYDTEFVRFSLELARDSSVLSVEELLGSLLGERMGRTANTQLTTGDGTGDPNGIVTASTLGKTAAGTTSVTYDEVIDLVHSVDPAYRQSPKTRFQFNDSVLANLRKLKDGDGRYIWTAGDVQHGVPGTILGYPYSINQAMASMTTGNKAMLFGDHSKYFVRKVGGPVIGVMRERFWPDLGIAGLIYLDGELADTAAVKHLVMA